MRGGWVVHAEEEETRWLAVSKNTSAPGFFLPAVSNTEMEKPGAGSFLAAMEIPLPTELFTAGTGSDT